MEPEIQKKEQPVIHKGIYINNERRKKTGGRIRSQSVDNKIQIFGNSPALHESEVEWIQVRRYVRGKPQKQEKTNEKQKKYTNKQSSKQEINEAKNKYKPKFIQKQPEQKKSKYVLKDQEKPLIKKQQFPSLQPNPIQQKNQKPQMQQKIKNELNNIGQKIDQKKIQTAEIECDTKQQSVNVQEQIDKDKESSSSQSQQSQEGKEIIVGKVVKQTKNKFQTQPFVGLLSFIDLNKNKKKQKFQEKLKQQKQNFINKLFQNYRIDIYPINGRLEVMEVEIQSTARDVISKYIDNNVKFQQNMNNKEKINKALDEIEQVYVLLKFHGWNKQGYPTATIIKIIGKLNTIDGQCASFLYQYGLDDFQHENQKQQFKQIQLKPTPQHKPFNHTVFTIDPKTSVDLDDALSVEKIHQDLYEIGIHISDVSSYLEYINRQQLIKRTTSVYLPHKTYHMLPLSLMKICSLSPNVERLAFTIFVQMNEAGQIIGQSRLQKNIIKSNFKLAYEQVQDIIVDKGAYEEFNQSHPCSKQDYEDLSLKLRKLATIGLGHRNKRVIFDVFQNRELRFQFDEDNWPKSVSIEKRFAAKKIVEEFMIIGNIEATKHLVKISSKNALVIHHPPPSQLSVEYFNNSFKMFGIQFKFKDSVQVQQQLLKIKQQYQDISQQVKQVCFFKARRTQQAASYKLYDTIFQQMKESQKLQKTSKIIHFALGQEFYTHFTSPMRRMADIIVHELLSTSITKTQIKQVPQLQIDKINQKRTATKRLKSNLTDLYICLMVKKSRKWIQTEAIIISMGIQSVSILLPEFDTMKQLVWKRQLKLKWVERLRKKEPERQSKQSKQKKQEKKQQEEVIRVYIVKDYKYPKNNIYYDAKKYDKIKISINSTKQSPLKMVFKWHVNTNKGAKVIYPAHNL